MAPARGLLFDIKRYAIHDGPGIRTTLFFKGCPLRCWWCHNPEGQRGQPEVVTRTITLDGSTIREEERCGRVMGVEDVMAEIDKDAVFYDESGGGVTMSGGEPLQQVGFVQELAAACHAKGIHVSLDTSGYAPPEVVAEVAPAVDLFLFDLKIMADPLHRHYTGVSNRLILQNLKYLSRKSKRVIVRFPLIPGITDTSQNVTQLGTFVASLDTVAEIDILPFHRIAAEKYRRFKKENRLQNLAPPPNQRVEEVKATLEDLGFRIRIGG